MVANKDGAQVLLENKNKFLFAIPILTTRDSKCFCLCFYSLTALEHRHLHSLPYFLDL